MTVTNTNNVVGITLALQYPYFWEHKPMPKEFDLDYLAHQRVQKIIKSMGMRYDLWEGGAQDSAYYTLKDLPKGLTWDEAIEAVEIAWFDTPTDHPIMYCHECEQFTQWTIPTFHLKCTVCGEWQYGESEEYLLEEHPLEYWTEDNTMLEEWEKFGPQEDGEMKEYGNGNRPVDR